MSSEPEYLTLDPSCFTSVENLVDALKVVRDYENPTRVIIPTEIYNVIQLEPDEKFEKLPEVLDSWLDDKNYFENLDDAIKRDYVGFMRRLFELNPSPAVGFVGDMEKIGENSIFKNGLINRFKEKAGKILFDLLGVSHKVKAKIIALSEKTFEMMRKFGSTVVKGTSALKRKIKENSKIKTTLLIGMLFMDKTDIGNFITHWQIAGLDISALIIPAAGLLILANG